jgi:hypothetical protein
MKRAMFLIFSLAIAIARADWTPPTEFDPDLEKFSKEAQADLAAGKYEDAYKKYTWFGLNAFKYNPNQETFAWTNYVKMLPTLEQMKTNRDEAFQMLRKGESRGPLFVEFSTFVTANKSLGEEIKTKEFIEWLDSNRPDVLKADHVIDLLMPTLVKFKEYRLCGEYLDSGDYYWQSQILKNYQELLRAAKAHDGIDARPHLQIYAEKQFCNRTETLVAVLIINDRKAEAQKISDEAEKIIDEANFKAQIEKSLNGEMPEPWP